MKTRFTALSGFEIKFEKWFEKKNWRPKALEHTYRSFQFSWEFWSSVSHIASLWQSPSMSPGCCAKLAFKKKLSFAKTLEKLGDCFERQVEAVGLFGIIPKSDPDTLVKVRHRRVIWLGYRELTTHGSCGKFWEQKQCCSSNKNQWTGFYMVSITASVKKELICNSTNFASWKLFKSKTEVEEMKLNIWNKVEKCLSCCWCCKCITIIIKFNKIW